MTHSANIKNFLFIIIFGFSFFVLSSFIYQWIMNATPVNFKELLFYPFLSVRAGYYLAPMTSFILAGLIMTASVFIWLGKVYRFIGIQIIYTIFALGVACSLTVATYGYLFEGWNHFLPWPQFIFEAIRFNREAQDQMLFFAFFVGFTPISFLYCSYISKEFFHTGRPLGKAKWANGFEMHKAKLFSNKGFTLGKSKYGKLRFPGYEPIIFVSGTGGGKTSGVVIPNLFGLDNENIVVTDIKGEIYKKTSDYRKKIGSTVYRFEPGSQDTHRYNPLGMLRKEHLDEDLDIIFKTLILDSHDPIWAEGSRSIAKMIAMYEILEKDAIPTLQGIYQFIADSNSIKKIKKLYDEIENPRVKNLFGKFVSVRDKAQSDLLMSAQEYLSKFDSPNLGYATSANDFDFRDLRKTLMTIYVVIPANTETFGPICSIFFEQMIRLTTENNEPDESEYTINAIIDEFANLPKMPSLAKGISFLRSYRIRVCAFIQQIAQLKEVYGSHRTEGFMASPVKVAFNVTSREDAEYFSNLAGERTIKVKNDTINQNMTMTVSNTYQHSKLISPDEVMRMNQSQLLIYCAGFNVIKCKKNFWFNDVEYKRYM